MKKIILLLSIVAMFTGCKKERGCTDPTAKNFNSSAEVDDGTCFGGAYTNSNADLLASVSSQEPDPEAEV